MTTDEVRCDDPLKLSQRSFKRFAAHITGELGIKMPISKIEMVQSRLLRRARQLGLTSFDDYCDYYFDSDNGSQERQHLVNAITTNKTDFFREAQHFEFLVDDVLPSICPQANRVPPVTIWSAGCSSGEEPYTLAIVLGEYSLGHAGFDFSILGTDVSTRVLDIARAGIYDESAATPIPEELRRKYLLRSRNATDHLVRIRPELRSRVHFHYLNFMDRDYRLADMFDVIFFRNVLIYFDRPTQEEVITKICRNLTPGGYLFVSHSESLAGLNVPVVPVRPSIFRKPARAR